MQSGSLCHPILWRYQVTIMSLGLTAAQRPLNAQTCTVRPCCLSLRQPSLASTFLKMGCPFPKPYQDFLRPSISDLCLREHTSR